MNRYVVRHEFGADYAVVDCRNGLNVACGLSEQEAEELASSCNERFKKSLESA